MEEGLKMFSLGECLATGRKGKEGGREGGREGGKCTRLLCCLHPPITIVKPVILTPISPYFPQNIFFLIHPPLPPSLPRRVPHQVSFYCVYCLSGQQRPLLRSYLGRRKHEEPLFSSSWGGSGGGVREEGREGGREKGRE